MIFEASLICDSASNYEHGKLCVLGAFDTIMAPQVPVKHRHCAVVFRVRLERSEIGKRSLRLLLIDDDGKPVGLQVDGEVGFFPSDDAPESMAMNFILNINDLMLPKFGRYRFDLFINGEHKASVPLFLVQPKHAQRAA